MVEETIESLKERLSKYEDNGAAKLYYSLQRKMNEMANLMNNTDLAELDIDDVKSKTFDRLKVIWQDAASIATAVKTLGEIAGITGDEIKDIKRKMVSPESMAQEIGDYKTQNV